MKIISLIITLGLFSCASENKRDKAVKEYKQKLQKQRLEAQTSSSEFIDVPQ